MRLGFVIPLSCWIAATVTSKRAAIEVSVSPATTVYVLVPDGSGPGLPPPGLGVTDLPGAGLPDGDGFGVRVGTGLVDGMGDGLIVAAGPGVVAGPAAPDGGLDSGGGNVVAVTEAADAAGELPAPPGADSPNRATAIAANATTRRTMRTAWPPARPAPAKGSHDGADARGRSRSTGVVDGIGRRWRPATDRSDAPRSSLAAMYVAQPGCSGVRHRRRCFSSATGTDGSTAEHRWSRMGTAARHVRRSVTRKGQSAAPGDSSA